MRETPNIKLTQFDPNDVPNWLDQYNSDMLKVDTAVGEQKTENSKYELRFTADEELINNNRTQISENTQDIANVKDDIKNIKGGSTTSIVSLQTEITGVSQSLTTLKGGSDRTIAELENDLNTDKAEISKLDGRVKTLENRATTLENSVEKIGTNITRNDTFSLNRDTEYAINRFTITSADYEGHYIATALLQFESNSSGYRRVALRRKRSDKIVTLGYFSTNATKGAETEFTFNTFPFDVKINDQFILYALQTSDSASLTVNSNISLFRLRK